MATPNEKLAQSLKELATLQAKGHRAVRSDMLTRTHRERLVKAGYLEEVRKSWYLPARPGESLGSTASWFAGMRDFISGYCENRFGADWHLSPEQSLLLRSGERSIPRQLQVWTTAGNNQIVPLPHGCSLFLYRAPMLLPAHSVAGEGGLRLVDLPSALVAVSQGFFVQQPMAARISLGLVTDAAELLQPLLDGSHSVVAGRLAGAFRSLGSADLANAIISTMRSANYAVAEV